MSAETTLFKMLIQLLIINFVSWNIRASSVNHNILHKHNLRFLNLPNNHVIPYTKYLISLTFFFISRSPSYQKSPLPNNDKGHSLTYFAVVGLSVITQQRNSLCCAVLCCAVASLILPFIAVKSFLLNFTILMI